MKQLRKNAQYDSIRPLTEREKDFASHKENHDLIYIYCHKNGLPLENWYDILIIPYLQAVKKYFEVEKLQQYVFSSILFKDLHRAYGNYYRDLNRKCRMPEGGIVSLDIKVDDSEKEDEYIGEWWIDEKQNVEQEMIDSAMLIEILENLNELQQQIFNMLLEGYNKTEIHKQLKIGYQTLNDQVEKLREVVRDYLNYCM